MEIRKILVIGAGQMGNGIAQVAAQSGYEVVMQDIIREAVDKGMAAIKKSVAKFVEKEKMTQGVEKTYAVINSALQLKGLISLYNRHKKELTTTISKIKKILKNMPTDSQLYKKTMANLTEIGSIQ